MAVAFRASASTPYNGTDGTSRTVTIPSGVQVGDVMILSASANSAGTPSLPSGWTSLDSWAGTFSNHRVYYKVAVSGDAGSNVTVTIPSSGRLSIAVSCYSGAANPSSFTKSAESGSTSINHPSVTASASTAWLVCGLNLYISSSSTTETVGSPLTSRVAQTCAWTHVAIGDQALSASGATGTRTSTVTSGFSEYAWSLLLEPGSSPQSINVGQATTTQTGRAISVTPGGVSISVARASTTQTGRTISVTPGGTSRSIDRATSTHTGRTITPSTGGVSVAIGRAVESETARAILADDGDTLHSIYNGAVPPGTYAVYTDGFPSIVLAETFYSYGGTVSSSATVVGGRVWTPSGSPTMTTIMAWVDATGVRDAAFNLDTTPVRSVTVATNVGGWTEATWTGFDLPDDGYRVMIGYQLGSDSTEHQWYVAATDAYADDDPVLASDGFHLAKSEFSYTPTDFGPVHRGYFRAGSGSPTYNASNHTGYGVDILVDDGTSSTQSIDIGRAVESDVARTVTPLLGATPVAIGRATESDVARTVTVTPAGLSIAIARADVVTNLARSITPLVGARSISIGRATETDIARAVTSVLNLIGRATESDVANPIGVVQFGSNTDTSNRVGGRDRDGLGVATWEPAVVAPPSSSAPVLAYDVAKAFGPISHVPRTQPSYDVSTALKPRQRDRILVDGVDVTFFRGVPTPLPSYQLVEPLLYGPATLTFPQIAGSFEHVGVGQLKWLRKGAHVVVQRVNAITNVVEDVDYRGIIIAFNIDGIGLSVEIGGHASGRAALQNRQTPLWHKVNDAGYWAWSAISSLRLHFEPRLGPSSGISLANWGGTSLLDYISELCAKAQDRDGTQWTIMPNEAGVYRFARKDVTTIDATIYLDDANNVANLRRDIAEEPNRVYVTGINPQGRRVRGAIFPGLNQGNAAPYPFSDHSTTFAQGTVDADTDTGDGVTVMIARLWATKYLDLDDVPGGYDNDARKAIRALQDDAGLSVTGIMNYATWRALFDLSATGFSLRGSHIEPLASRSSVRKWLRTSSGALLARNPDYDPSVLPVDVNVDMGVGFKANQLREWAQAELSNGDNWVGTIALNTGGVVDGEHTPGDPIDAADVRRARSIKPGMNVWCPQFMGGTLFHVSAVSVDASSVTLTVDTRARDTMKVWEIIQRNRDTRANPARAWIAQHRSSTMTNDGVAEWDAAGGVIEKLHLHGEQWNVFPVAAGQEGTVARLRVRTDPAAEYVMAVFGRSVTPEWLEAKVPEPLTEDGTKRWESERIRRRLDARFLLYAAGTFKQPCGYFPGKLTNDDGDTTTDRLTGRHEDDAGFSYHTFAEPVLYVAVWPGADTTVQAGRIMWNQLETSS